MSRYISEYQFSNAGGKITLPTCARFIGVTKVANHFVLITEVWGNPDLVYEIDIRVFHKDEYIIPESIYIGHTVAGTMVYHFSYTHGEVLDLGGDGGVSPENFEEPKPVVANEILEYTKPAGGMSEC